MKPHKLKRLQANPRRAEDLLAKARAQPGVRTLMRVYGRWRQTERLAYPYLQVLEPRPLISASDSSRASPW